MPPLLRTLLAGLLLWLIAALPASPAASQDARSDTGPPLPLVEFRAVPLDDALRLLSAESGLNIVPSATAGARVVSLYLRGVTALAALDVLCRSHDLRWQRDPATRIIRVITLAEYNAAASELAAEPRVVALADGTVSIDAHDAPLPLLMERFGMATGRNAVAHANAYDARVTAHLSGLAPLAALQALCDANDLSMHQDPETGVLRVHRGPLPGEELTVSATGGADAMRLTLDIREQPLRAVLAGISGVTGMNLAASADAGARKVSLRLVDVDPHAALDTLVKTHALWMREEPATGIIRIHTVEEYRRDVASFREERTAVYTLMFANALEVAIAVRDLFGDRILLTLGREEDQEVLNDLQRRLARFDLFDSRSQGLSLGGFGEDGSSGGANRTTGRVNDASTTNDTRFGVGANTGLAGTNSAASRARQLLEQQSPELADDLSADEVGALEAANGDPAVLARLMMRYSSTVFMTVSRRHNRIIVRSADPDVLEQVGQLIPKLDLPTPLVLLEVKILSIELGNGLDSIFDYQAGEGDTTGGFSTGEIAGPAAGSLTPGGTGITAGNVLFQFVGDAFRARMQALETENRVTALATPLLLTANNEVSRLFVGEERPINRSFVGPQTLLSDDGQTTTPGTTDIEFRPVGTTLLITPSIASDRTVTLRILQETSSIREDGANVLVPTDTGFEEVAVDIVQARTVSGTVVARHGHSVAIGGLIEEQMRRDVEQVPILGQIPILGILFQRRVDRRSRSELVVVVRPWVLNTPAESEQVSRRLLEELSLHPNAPGAHGTMGTYDSDDVIAPDQPGRELRELFRFHSLDLQGGD